MADYKRNHMFFAVSTIIMLAAAAYATQRLIADIHPPLPWAVACVALLALLSQSITLTRVVVTGVPGLSLTWIRAGGYISAVFLTLVSLLLIRDAAALLLWAASAVLPEAASLQSWLFGPRAAAWLVAGSALFAAAGMWSALRVPRVREVDIAVPTLPEELEGLRIAQLSDLHVGSTFDGLWLRDVVERTNALEPDLILITGDLVDGPPSMLREDMLHLLQLRARLGVLISVGNHEYYSGVMPWLEVWRQQGLTVLLNEHRVLDVNGAPLVVAGVADPNAERFPGLVPPDPEAARAGAPQAFSILMAHQPKDAAVHAALGYDLQLSGHTHGGQYFFLFPLVSWMNNGYRSGLYDVKGMKLYVNPGTGLWGYVPMRVGSPSEITILTLTRSPKPGASGG